MDRTASLSSTAKVEAALRRSLPRLPSEAKAIIERMLEPASLAIITASIVAWAGSHLVGVGEFVDFILLVVGAVALGFSVFEGAHELLSFATTAVGAQTEADLDRSAQQFARAVTILGISTVQALLLRGGATAIRERGVPRYRLMEPVGEPPLSGNQLRVSRPATLDSAGLTDAYGAIQVTRDQSLSEQRLTLLHELVHRFFSPRTGPLRRFRASLNMTGYARSAFLRYLEEALAEGYAQLQVHGLSTAVRQWRFPLDYGYVTVTQLGVEGQAIGTIALGGMLFRVSISIGPMPRTGSQ